MHYRVTATFKFKEAESFAEFAFVMHERGTITEMFHEALACIDTIRECHNIPEEKFDLYNLKIKEIL